MIIYIDIDTGLIVSNAASETLPNVEQRDVTPQELEALIAIKSLSDMTQKDKFYKIEQAITNHIRTTAQSDGWDNEITCMARASYANPWQVKAAAFATWVDACWVHTLTERDKIIAGTRLNIPTPDAAIAELPIMAWPI